VVVDMAVEAAVVLKAGGKVSSDTSSLYFIADSHLPFNCCHPGTETRNHQKKSPPFSIFCPTTYSDSGAIFIRPPNVGEIRLISVLPRSPPRGRPFFFLQGLINQSRPRCQ